MFHGDCLDIMPTLADKSVDLFICDLPYGCLNSSRKKQPNLVRSDSGKPSPQIDRWVMGCSWDIKIDLDKFWQQVKRLAKDDHTPVIMFCTTKFGNELINSNPSWFRYDLVWSKTNGVGFLSANKQPLRSHEMMYVFAKKGAYYKRVDEKVEGAKEWKQFGKVESSGVYGLVRKKPVIREVGTITSKEGVRCVKSVIDVQNKREKGKHPTQKPAELYEWLIERYSKEGDTVLDPTAGSFTCYKQALKMNRKAIGIELNKEFYDKANT